MIFLLIISIIAIVIAAALMFSRWKEPSKFSYEYSADTNLVERDHQYSFYIERLSSGYRCYIRRTPSFRGRNTANYLPHYLTESFSGEHYICWTGKLEYLEQAKTLCRNWADATQKFIDTGIPAPGFKR